MRTIEIKVYQFDELDEKAKEKAIESHRYCNVDYEWWDSVYEDAERIGLKIRSFSLDRDLHTTGEFELSANEVAQNIFNEHGENCGTYATAENFIDEWQPVFNEYMLKEVQSTARNILRAYRSNLYKDNPYKIFEKNLQILTKLANFSLPETNPDYRKYVDLKD